MKGPAVVMLDPGGRVLGWNPVAEAVYGFGADEVVGEHLGALYPEGDAKLAAEHLLLAGESGVWAGEVERARKGGRFRVGVEITAQRTPDGGLLGFSDVARAGTAEARFLAKASAILASSLDYQQTLSGVAGLVVPRLADWCVVDVVEEDGSLHNVATAHKDPEKAALARRLRERYPPDPEGGVGAARVVRTGEAELVPEIPAALLDRVARDGEHRRILQELDLSSYMVVPLAARGRTLGAITLAAAAGRRFGERELELVEDLASDAALAVDNARLYQEARRAEDRYRALVEQMPAVTYIEEPDAEERETRLTYASPQIEDLFGFTAEEWTSDPELFVNVLHPDDRERVLAEDERTEKTGEPFRAEYRQYTRDGRLMWVRDEATLVRDEDGRPLYWQGVILDISDQKRAEEALRESEERLRLAVEVTGLGTFDFDPVSGEVVWDGQSKRIFGLPPDAGVTFDDFVSLVHPEDRAPMDEAVRRMLDPAGDGEFDTEYRIVRPGDGATRRVDAHGRAFFEGGRAVRCLGTVLDVTEERRAEEALRLSEERYRTVVERAAEGIYLVDAGTARLLQANRAFCRLLGYRREEVVGRPIFDFLDHDPAEVRRNMETVPDGFGRELGERRYRRKDGTLLYVVSNASALVQDGRRVISILIHDVTESRLAEEALRRSEASLRAAQAMASIGDWEYDLSSDAARWSEELFRIFGLPPGKPPDFRGFFGLVHPEDRAAVRREVFSTLRSGGESSMDYRIRRPDGRVRSVHTEYRVAADGAGRPTTMFGTIQDVTERKRFEDAIRASERRFRQLFENSGDALFVHDEESRIVDCNREACRSLGYAREELLRMRVGDFAMDMLSAEERRAMGDDTFWKRAMRAEPGEIVGFHENTHRRKDGTTFPVEVGIGSIEYGGRKLVFASARDITERKRAEEELAERMEELRRSNAELEQFAYVASHDLQEPLRMVSSFTQLLRRRYEGRLDETADEFIGYAVDGANRMQALINALLEYSRVGTRGRPFAPVDTGRAFEAALANLRNAVSEAGAEVESGALPTALGDEVQLMQLFQNLISNAIKFRGEEPPRVRVEARRQGRDWLFSVRDNGIGIAEEYRDRIFVIFQRLHGREQFPGTGIGLALCKKIVERHGGRIWVQSEPGEGSTFFFTLRAPG